MAWKGKYELIFEGTFNGKIPIKKYISLNTHLKVALASVPGPLVHGKFSIATEDMSDDGLPHILEHVIFLGSEEYPHKGVLDKVATRCFSNGTNAVTDTDVTIYEITTAGQEGFCNILPVYLEHILFPKLTDAAYCTEVYHVDGEGRDAGTVYSEMQERENTCDDLVDLALRRALYPSPFCGYRFNTGGLLENIRNSTDNQKVKDFHRRFYRPENLCLTVVGVVDEDTFFDVLSTFEQKLLAKGPSSFFKRPWLTPIEPLTSSSSVQVLFASDEEDEGQVTVAWRGTSVNDSYQMTACSIMLDYLQEGAVSPLYQAFVEVGKPLCADIEYSVYENLQAALVLTFSSVPLNKLSLIAPKLEEVLTGVAERGFDMKRMASVLKNRLMQTFNDLESDPAGTISNDLTLDFLYACNNTNTDSRLNVRHTLAALEKEEVSFWTSLLHSYFLHKPHVTVIAKPSSSLVQEHEKAEDERVQMRKLKLGTEGLLSKASVLAASIKQNEQVVPEEILQSFKIPSLSSIQPHSILTFSNHSATHSTGISAFKTHAGFSDLPLTFHLHDIDSSFVTINILMDASKLPPHLLPYLTLFNELLFESPVQLEAEFLEYETVVARLLEETVEYTASTGWAGDRFVCGEFASYIHFSIKVEIQKYREGVCWCRDLLTGLIFRQDRLRSVASKCLGDARTEKKDARVMMEQLNCISVYQQDSPMVASTVINQFSFLKSLLSRKNNSFDLENLKEVSERLVKTGNMLVHMSANLSQLSESVSATYNPGGDNIDDCLSKVWKECFVSKVQQYGGESKEIEVWPLKRDMVLMREPSSNTTIPSHILMGLGSTDSSYLTLHAPCITDFHHPDYAALFALCYFVNMLEGPLWRCIRGNGLAYGFGLHLDVNQGLNFRLLGSTNLTEAFRRAHTFMSDLCDGKVAISQSELECARCDCIFELLSMQATPQHTSDRSFLCNLRNLSQSFYSNLIEKVGMTTSEQLSRVACTYLNPLMTNNTAVITCPISQVSKVAKLFNDSFQLKFTVYKKMEKFP